MEGLENFLWLTTLQETAKKTHKNNKLLETNKNHLKKTLFSMHSSNNNRPIISLPKALNALPEEVATKIFAEILGSGSTAIPGLDFIQDLLNQLNDEDGKNISIFFRAAIYSINFFSAEDPSKIHYSVSREILKHAGGEELEANEKARDMLARELVRGCREFAAQIIPSQFLQANTPDAEKALFIISKMDADATHLITEVNGKLWLDDLFIQYIKKFGTKGDEAAKKLSDASTDWYNHFKENKKASELFRWWVDQKTSPYSCKFLKCLAMVVWDDKVKALFEKDKKNVPALTHGVHPAVTRILSPRVETRTIKNELQMTHDGKIIATLPTIDPKLLAMVTKGAGSLNSIYHHRLIRFECKTGFENWINSKTDPRVLRFERGCTEITEQLGLTSNKAIEEIKAILVAQAYMHFTFDDESCGNLIVLRNFRSRGCNRDNGVEIVLGTQLLPHYTFQTSKRASLLIPVPDLPPLVSSSNYHAGQALLQMMVMQEFSEQSIEFAETGSVIILKDKWEKFAKESGLPESVFKQTLARWNQDGDDLPRFLINPEPDRYALGGSYKKEADFLKQQGLLRKQRKKSGELSVNSRRKKKIHEK